MGTNYVAIRVKKKDFNYKKFIQEICYDKVIGKYNFIDKYYIDRRGHNEELINIDIYKYHTDIYSGIVSDYIEKNNLIMQAFKDIKILHDYQVDSNCSIGYSLYDNGVLVQSEYIDDEEEEKKIIDKKLSNDEQDELINNFYENIYFKKYQGIYDNLEKIKNNTFYNIEDTKILKRDSIVLKNNFSDLKIFLQYYLSPQYIWDMKTSKGIPYYVGLGIVFITTGIPFHLSDSVTINILFIILSFYLLYILTVVRNKNKNTLSKNIIYILLTFSIFIVINSFIYALFEILKIRLM